MLGWLVGRLLVQLAGLGWIGCLKVCLFVWYVCVGLVFQRPTFASGLEKRLAVRGGRGVIFHILQRKASGTNPKPKHNPKYETKHFRNKSKPKQNKPDSFRSRRGRPLKSIGETKQTKHNKTQTHEKQQQNNIQTNTKLGPAAGPPASHLLLPRKPSLQPPASL